LETQSALQILTQAANEMEAITVEKKQLLQQWKNSLIGMEKRDEMLREKQEATTKVRETLMVMDAEANGYKLATKIEQDKNEQLTQILNKVSPFV
jgi:coiled-coil domain-containing protein 40